MFRESESVVPLRQHMHGAHAAVGIQNDQSDQSATASMLHVNGRGYQLGGGEN